MGAMQGVRRGTAAGAALMLSMMLSPIPVQAVPSPREEEWWFKAWSIQDKVWPISKGQGVTVAVVDSGVNARIPDLRGVVLRGEDISTEGDGRQDYDADEGGHGTAMAVLIAGQGSRTGIVGVAPDARILPISVVGTEPEWAKALRYAIDHGAKVINISQGTFSHDACSEKLQSAFDYAIHKDAVVVVSAGNEGHWSRSPEVPARCHGALVVGAVDSRQRIWQRSSPASYVSVTAPGVQISTVGAGGTLLTNGYGTSQATALTSGIVALIRSKYPKMPARRVAQRIIATAKDTGPAGWDDRSGFGIVMPHRALTKEVPANAPNPVFDRLDRWKASQPRTPNATATPNGSPRLSREKRASETSLTIIVAVGIFATALIVGATIVYFRGWLKSF